MIESGSEELAGIQEHDRVPAELDSIQLVRGSRAGRQTVRPDSRLAGAGPPWRVSAPQWPQRPPPCRWICNIPPTGQRSPARLLLTKRKYNLNQCKFNNWVFTLPVHLYFSS